MSIDRERVKEAVEVALDMSCETKEEKEGLEIFLHLAESYLSGELVEAASESVNDVNHLVLYGHIQEERDHWATVHLPNSGMLFEIMKKDLVVGKLGKATGEEKFMSEEATKSCERWEKMYGALAEKYQKLKATGVTINDVYRMLDEIGLPRGKDQLLITSKHFEDLAQAILARMKGGSE